MENKLYLPVNHREDSFKETPEIKVKQCVRSKRLKFILLAANAFVKKGNKEKKRKTRFLEPIVSPRPCLSKVCFFLDQVSHGFQDRGEASTVCKPVRERTRSRTFLFRNNEQRGTS